MQKEIVSAVALIFTLVLGCNTAPNRRMDSAIKEYPFGLLGDDYGILNVKDLALNAQIAEPKPFSPESISYPYWQCFESKKAAFLCDHSGIKDRQPNEAFIVVAVSDANGIHEYLARLPMDLESCEKYQSEWSRLTRGESHVCLSGPFISSEVDSKGKSISSWVFDKYKTRKGCDSYFDGACGS